LLAVFIFDLDSYFHNRVLRWAGHVTHMPINRARDSDSLVGWRTHPIGCPEMSFGRTLKKALKHNNLPTDFVTWSAIAGDRPRWWPSLRRPAPRRPALRHPALSTPNQPFANPNAPLPGYGNLIPAYVVPAWHAPLAQAQHAQTRAAGRAARYAAHANRANAPPQQHHLAQGIALGN
jgi:hypothetical protein